MTNAKRDDIVLAQRKLRIALDEDNRVAVCRGASLWELPIKYLHITGEINNLSIALTKECTKITIMKDGTCVEYDILAIEWKAIVRDLVQRGVII